MCRDSGEYDDHIFDLSYVLPENLVKTQYEDMGLPYTEWKPVATRIKKVNLQNPLTLPTRPGRDDEPARVRGSHSSGPRASVPTCENDGVVRGARLDALDLGEEERQPYLNVIFPEISYPPYQFHDIAERDAIVAAELKHKRIAAASLNHRLCIGNELLMRICVVCESSKIRDCRYEKCMQRRRALRHAAPSCRWQSFRELVLTAIACNIINFPRVMSDLIYQQYLREIRPPHFTCVDVHGMLDVLLWAQRITSGMIATLPEEYPELYTKLLRGYSSNAITASRKCLEYGYCPNRLWNISHQGPHAIMDIPPVAKIASRHPAAGDQLKHARCTDQFCVYSHDNNTQIQQAHKCGQGCAQELSFPPDVLNAAFTQQSALGGSQLQDHTFHTWHQAAWSIEDHELTRTIINPAQAYMAISHVWSDGTGVGRKNSGYVNKCLFSYFAEFATRLGCKGVWWDAISIPTDRDARRTAMNTMLSNYEKAAVTLVHDEELVNFDWQDDGSPAVALVLSSWFTRGWTAAELYASRSHSVKVVYKDPKTGGPILKDLDMDVLASDTRSDIASTTQDNLLRAKKIFNSQGHLIASDILRQLRQGRKARQVQSNLIDQTDVSDLRGLLRIMRSRSTSWHRDRLIIPGLMYLRSVQFDTAIHSTEITQKLMNQFGRISISDLFHSEVPLTRCGPWSWCPPSVFDLGQSYSASSADKRTSCRIEDGRLWGRFEAVAIRPKDVLVPYGSHPAARTRTSVALSSPSECFLLTDPSIADSPSLCILAKPVSVIMRGKTPVISCRWLGCVYLARERGELSQDDRKLRSLNDQEGKKPMFEFGSDADQHDQPLSGFPTKQIILAVGAFTKAKWEEGRYTWYLKNFLWNVRRDFRVGEDNRPSDTQQITFFSPICFYSAESLEVTTEADKYVSSGSVALFLSDEEAKNVEQDENSMTQSFLASLSKHIYSGMNTCNQHGKECCGTVTMRWSFPYPPPDSRKMKRRMFTSTFHVPRWANETHPGVVFGRETMRVQINRFILTDQDPQSRSKARFIHSSYLEELEDECAQLIARNHQSLKAFEEEYNSVWSFDNMLKDHPSEERRVREEAQEKRRWRLPKMSWKKSSSQQ